MGAARVRVIATVVILLVLAGVGAFWLTRLATAEPATTAFVDPSDSPAVTDATGPTAAVPSTTTDPPATTGDPTRSARPEPRSTTVTQPHVTTSSTSRQPSPPRPREAINVGGVTLDNINPVTMCAAFKNPSGTITVEVTAVALSNPDVKPQSDLCAGDGNIEEFPADRACRSGVTLRAGEPGCYVGIAAKSDRPPDDYKSTVSVTVKGRCTSTALNPCDASELKASPPTPAHPVDVTWTTSRSGVCYRVASPDPDPFCA